MLTSAMWSSWVEINPKTGDNLGIQQGDLVEVASPAGTLRVPAILSPGIAPDIIAMPVGQGHENFGRFASGQGANPLSILAPVTERETGSLAWAATRVKLTRRRPGTGQVGVVRGGNEQISRTKRNPASFYPGIGMEPKERNRILCRTSGA